MIHRLFFLVMLIAAGGTFAGCDGDSDSLSDDAAPMIEQYAQNARDGYAASATKVHDLDAAIDAFVDDPSEESLDAARAAWIAARAPYRLTEALRFYGGPIDDPADEREPSINAWPMDEAHVDYVVGNATAGIINNPDDFPTIDAATLIEANFAGGENDVSIGFHAIEFLLWGQDRAADGAGERPYTDYVDNGGTADNEDRRRQYLTVVSDLLVADLDHVAARWSAGGDYTAIFTADPIDSLTWILTGIGTLAASELSGERMLVAYDNKDQEDEHSCFSDTTRDDLIGNLAGIDAVWYGRGTADGPGLDELVAARDAALAERMADELAAASAAMTAIPAPFDQAILGEDTDEGRTRVREAFEAVQVVGATIVDVSEALDVSVSTEL